MNRFIVILCVVSACGARETQAPQTTYLAEATALRRWFSERGGWVGSLTDFDQSRPKAVWHREQIVGWLAAPAMPSATLTLRGDVQRVCAVALGPNLLRQPTSLDFIGTWVADEPTVAKAVSGALAEIDPRYEFGFDKVVAGVRVRVVQSPTLLGVVFFAELDGCARDTATSAMVVDYQRSMPLSDSEWAGRPRAPEDPQQQP